MINLRSYKFDGAMWLQKEHRQLGYKKAYKSADGYVYTLFCWLIAFKWSRN